MPRITQRTLGSLEPEEKPRFIRDSELIGFGIKVNPTGRAKYFAEARVKGGRVVRKTIGDVDLLALDEAKTEARSLLFDLKKGVDIGRIRPVAPPEPDTLAELTQRYLTERTELRPRTCSDYQSIMNACCEHLMGRKVSSITPADVAEIYRNLTSRASVSYARKALRTLRAILNSSDIPSNPVSVFFRRSGATSTAEVRIRYLSADEIISILEASRHTSETDHPGFPHFVFCQLLAFYLTTGLRKNEALNLTRDDCTDDVIRITNTKSGKDHELPIAGIPKSIIQDRLEKSQSNHLWSYSESSFRTQLKKTRDTLNFKEPWTIHDLRRTFAEHCSLIGIDQNVIAACLNHAPVGVTQRNYLGGGLARKAMIEEVYEKLEQQLLGYYFGMDEVRHKPGETWTSRISGDR